MRIPTQALRPFQAYTIFIVEISIHQETVKAVGRRNGIEHSVSG